MVARAQSSDFTIFMRKIGYSVGLENTLSRLRDFSNLYAGQESISIGDIKRLLHAPKPIGWELEPQNEHILDFLRSIDVVTIRGGDVGVLEFGEALGILGKLLADEQFEVALKFLLTHALVLADGDIFLNALASEFDEVEFLPRITRMVEYKWTVLEEVFKTGQQRAAIYRAVTVETQENNPGSRGKANPRTGPLAPPGETKRVGPLSSSMSRPDVRVSPNYLVKTLGRRKAWAYSLDLCDDRGSLTYKGQELLSALSAAGYSGPSCMAMWPLTYELKTPLFSSIMLPDKIPRCSSWDFMVLIGRALGVLGSKKAESEVDDLDGLDKVIRCFYSLNKSRSIVRNEVPLRVVYRCLLGLSIGKDNVPDYPSLIRAEQGRKAPRFIARESRLAEMALSVAR
ncbi:hypothetical protein QFP33_001596 [Pseudomonas aeruginosa]|nr:hypothetical protein [Pseudomonas aeruginosa]ELR9615938.1 hypothetical protein [Pseudomonas aeruginosa]